MKISQRKVGSPPTIIDVADRAGVSMKTVSRVVNDETGVRPKTRARVLEAIENLGYQRNVFARGLRAERSLVLGLLYENPQGDYPADILHGALARCRQEGYHLVVEILRGEDMGEQTKRFLSQTRLDGVVMTPPICDEPLVLKALNNFDVPFVRISPKVPFADEQYIAIDDYGAARQVVDYLVRLGHQHIALIKGIEGHAATTARLAGFYRGLKDAGIEPDENLVIDGNFDFDSGYVGAEKLLALDQPPTAIFASNDETAAGILGYAHMKGIRVPDELSVCGFDGGPISKVVYPKLTTVMQPIRLLGDGAVRLLIAIAGDEPQVRGEVILAHELVIGASTTTRA